MEYPLLTIIPIKPINIFIKADYNLHIVILTVSDHIVQFKIIIISQNGI